MNLELIIILIIMVLFIVTFIFIEPLFMKHKVKNKNEYGSARFSTQSEIKNNFKSENINKIKEAGFPVSFSKDLQTIYFDRETPHYVYLGSTGSGKSVTAVIPTCAFIAHAQKKRSVFITDPKGEIYSTTSFMFKNNGYNILTIDFRQPELSNKINILQPIINEYEKYIDYENKYQSSKDIKDNNKAMSSLAETNRLISSLATMVMTDKVESKDPFWNNSAKNLLEGLIGFFLEEYKLGNIKKEQITMTSIRKFQNSSMEEKNFKKFVEYINSKEYGSKSKDALISILSASDKTYKSITAVFGEKMNIFDDINVANVTSSSDFDLSILGKQPTALYVIVPDEDKVYYSLVTITVGLLYKELVKLANSYETKKLPYEIDFILDEFANCPPLADIESLVSVARSRGMHFHFFIQSFSQLNNIYGKEVAQIILDNCGLIYLKTNTEETAQAISKRLGRKTIESGSIRQSVSLLDYNGDRTTNLIGRELMTPEEVMGLHYKTIIFPIIGFPIFRDTVIYKKFKCYESGKVERNINPLKDLSYTYFTVEDIKYDNKTKEVQTEKDLYEDQAKQEKKELQKIEDKLKTIFKNTVNVRYNQTENYNIYSQVKLDRKLHEYERKQLEVKIKANKYHTEIIEENNTTTINIYLKSILEQEM